MEKNELVSLLEKMNIFDRMYEAIRIVDPEKKEILNYIDNKISKEKTRCFDYWGKGQSCENCISTHALNENRIFTKMEYTNQKIYIVTAVPMEIEGKKVIVELFSNTDSSILYSEGTENSSEVHTLIDNLNNIAVKDSLTGIYNRYYINEKLPIDLKNVSLTNSKLSIIMADIDFFKDVNDTYGHVAGDEVLKTVAKTFDSCLKRDSDWLARFGGEEFMICLPGANNSVAYEIAENMRKAIGEKEIEYEKQKIQVTVSFGVFSINKDDNLSLMELIQNVDNKLYEAKRTGRNKVVR